MFKRKKRRKYLYILFLVALLYTMHRYVLSMSQAKEYFYSGLLYPVLLSQKKIILPVKNFFTQRKNKLELQELVFNLHEENKKLVQENIELRSIINFHNQTREVLEFAKQYKIEKKKLCQVLFRNLTQNSHFIYVDKGSSCGVLPNMVAVYKNCLLGRVTDVYPFYSKVLLITDKLCKVAAYCADTGSNGIHVGKNSMEYTSLDRVSHLCTVQKGDLVLSSGYGLVFPQGFALGKIAGYISGDLYHQIDISPVYNIQDIDYCFLIQKGAY